MRATRKMQNLFVVTSLFVAALGFGGSGHAMTIAGNTDTSSPTPIFSLSFTSASFNPDVPVGAGWTDIELGTFILSQCLTTSCNDNYGTQDSDFDDFLLKITFTIPTVSGSPDQFGADIFGTFGREGNSDEIKNGSSLTIDFDNTVHTLAFTGGPGGSFGLFDLYVDDVAPFGPYSNSGSKFSEEDLSRLVVGHIGNLRQEFPTTTTTTTTTTSPTSTTSTTSVPEPSSFLLLFAGLLVVGRSIRGKWFRN
jgi:hypothetical protein